MRVGEPIKLRWKKIGNGREAAFLDITIPDRPRKREYLRLYRGGDLPKAKSRENERLAQAICQKRLDDYNAARAGVRVYRTHRLLLDYYDECSQDPSIARHTRSGWLSSRVHLIGYLKRIGEDERTLVVGDIDGNWCKGYLHYLQYDATLLPTTKTPVNAQKTEGRHLASSTVRFIFSRLKTCLSRAVRDGLIATNPAMQVGRIKTESKRREHLDITEVRRLMASHFPNDRVCRAFLFSCLTGLRHSDIRQLRWDMVKHLNGHYRIDFSQVKTKGQMYLDISDLAFSYMGDRTDGLVFKGLPEASDCSVIVARWCNANGIDRHITFHCARHTAAVSLLTAGVEIYTVSKILGHTSLSSTQIYADIVDAKRRDAVDALADLVGGHLGDNEVVKSTK